MLSVIRKKFIPAKYRRFEGGKRRRVLFAFREFCAD